MESLSCVTVLTKCRIRRRNDGFAAFLQIVSVAQQASRQYRKCRYADGCQVLTVRTKLAWYAPQTQHISGNQLDQSLCCSQLLK
jgi:hypothetical protein